MFKSLLLLMCFVTVTTAWAAKDDAYATLAASDSQYPKLNFKASKASLAQIQHGEYLVKMGDCFTCHTDEENDGLPFAGGLKITTDFGVLHVPNITPDKETGIGNWTDKQFVRAVREGISKDGSYYYPVFPYNYFSQMSEQDVLDMKAYLDIVPAVHQQNHAQEMNWPFNYRILQLGWRLLYFTFDQDEFKSDIHQSSAWNRGKFIVEGPGHCALCHSQLNYLGVPKQKYYLAGNFVEGYYAPNIAAQGFKKLSEVDVANIFRKNEMPTHGELSGPMRGVEHNSLRFLTNEDLLGIATYLKTIQSQTPPVEVDISKNFTRKDGKNLYESSCAMCHDDGLMGAPSLEKKVWSVLLDQGREKLYEVTIRGNGDMPAKGGCDTCSNGRLKAAVDYMIEQAVQYESKHDE